MKRDDEIAMQKGWERNMGVGRKGNKSAEGIKDR
jgi:hypothetical protein